MGREALHCFCVTEEEVTRVEREFRARDRERLAGQSRDGDLHASKHLMFRADRALPDQEEEPAPG
jgi:hypothetical protein